MNTTRPSAVLASTVRVSAGVGGSRREEGAPAAAAAGAAVGSVVSAGGRGYTWPRPLATGGGRGGAAAEEEEVLERAADTAPRNAEIAAATNPGVCGKARRGGPCACPAAAAVAWSCSPAEGGASSPAAASQSVAVRPSAHFDCTGCSRRWATPGTGRVTFVSYSR